DKLVTGVQTCALPISLPMARSALLVGRTLADLGRNVFVVILMVAVGFAVGFRIHGGVLDFLAACALVLLFGYALSWVFASIGLRSEERRVGKECICRV